MHNKYMNMLSALALIVGINSVAQAIVLPTAIQLSYKAMSTAIESSNHRRYWSFFAPQFVTIDSSGKKHDRAALVNQPETKSKGVLKKSVKATFTDVKTVNGITDVSFDSVLIVVYPNGKRKSTTICTES